MAFAQQKEEFETKKTTKLETETELLEKQVLQEKKTAQKKRVLVSSIEVSGGYDANPRLESIRKGDTLGSLKYSLFFATMVSKTINFNINYDFYGTAYSRFHELTNLLNHTRFTLEKHFNPSISAGAGYDFSNFYYPEDAQSGYSFHKGFVYLRHNFTKTIYHQITFGDGVKYFSHARAYLNSTSTYLDEKRRDYRKEAEYSFGLPIIDKAYFTMLARYSLNDSNSLYQQYDDYQSIDFIPNIYYQIFDKLSMDVSLTATDKWYKGRLVTNATYPRKDWLFNVDVGFRYYMNRSNSVSVDYGYNDNKSNDRTAQYTGNSVICGYQYLF